MFPVRSSPHSSERDAERMVRRGDEVQTIKDIKLITSCSGGRLVSSRPGQYFESIIFVFQMTDNVGQGLHCCVFFWSVVHQDDKGAQPLCGILELFNELLC